MRNDHLPDGLYRIDRYGICAGFVVKDNRITHCAPILRRRLEWWKTVATWIGP